MKNIHKTITFILVSILSFNLGITQTNTIPSLSPTLSIMEITTIFELLNREDVQEITIKTDIKHLLDNKSKNKPKYQTANMSFKSGEGIKWNWKIKVKPRGNLRKTYCSFPPIKLKFSKKMLQGIGLDSTFNTLKIVSHCKEKSIEDDLLMREYLAYRMYNLLTNNSYRVKLLRINYMDIAEEIPSQTHWAFVLENTREMTSRINGQGIRPTRLTLPRLKNDATALMDIFQFMIGNTDYSTFGLHNLKLLDIKDHAGVIPIPFDFDFSGLVDASYAIPAEGLNIDNVKQRVFTGLCQSENDWDKAIKTFQNKKSAILELVNNNENLKEANKKITSQYISSFYTILDNPSKVEQLIKGRCEN